MTDLAEVVVASRTAFGEEVCVKPACRDDERFVIEAFKRTLEPYYGGNHAAHARRLVRTHLNGGEDTRGLLSMTQQLLVLWLGTRRAGLVNLVFKRQQTCKLSPLIVSDHGRRSGLGSLLLAAAEQVSLQLGARQLYCTVAERNTAALTFFLQHGFAPCAASDDQYKEGETEVALSKCLSPLEIEPGPRSVISVMPLVTEDWPEVRRLFARHLHRDVCGFETTWIDTMSNPPEDGDLPVEERHPRWVYVATDRLGDRRAATVVARKKGDALKAMPVVAQDLVSFEALILDLPLLLAGKGRKVYLHMWPTTDEVRVLQEAGWDLEGLLPGAYHPAITTQQWGFPLTGGGYVPNLRINLQYLDQILDGSKSLEVRVGYDHILSIQPGDTITLSASDSTKASCKIVDVRKYDTFDDLVLHEDPSRIIPGENADSVLKRLRDIYPKKKEDLGPIVLELADITLVRRQRVSNANR